MLISKLIVTLLVCTCLTVPFYSDKDEVDQDNHCYVEYRSPDNNYILKLFKDSNSQLGASYFCCFDYPIHYGGGRFFANCRIKNNEILILNPIVMKNYKIVNFNSRKIHFKSKKRKIILKVKSDLVPYYMLVDSHMIHVEKSSYTLMTSKDTVIAEFFFKEVFSDPEKLAVNHEYKINLEVNYRQFPFLKWIPEQAKITRGYFRNDSIVFPCVFKDLILIKKKDP